MKFSCDQCQAQYMIADEKVGPKGVKVRCKKCGHVISVKKEVEAQAETKPAAAPADAGGPSFDDMFGGNEDEAGGTYERAATKVFTSQDLERVRQEQMVARGGPNDVAASPGQPTEQEEHSAPATLGALALEQQAAASSSLAALAHQAETAPSPQATQPEWYLALNDEQVGPLTEAEITTRWDRGEAKADTLAWKAGLADWAPVSQVKDLVFLMSRPQATPLSRSAAQPSMPEAEKEEEKKEVVTWRPSGASALADLAKEAFVEPPAPKAPPPEASPLGDFQPQAETLPDPFGQAAPAAGPSTVWQFPSAPARRRSGAGKWVAITLLSVVVLMGGGFAALYFTGMIAPQAQPGAVAQAVTPPPATAPQAAQPAVQPATTPPAKVEPTTPPTGQAAAPAKAEPARAAKQERGSKPRQVKDDSEDKPQKAAPQKGGDDFDDLLSGKGKGKSLKPTLDRNDVLGSMKVNAQSVQKCFSGDTSAPAKLIVKFVIKPSGHIEGAEVGSPEVKGSSAEGCVLGAMKRWKFPEYQSGNIPVTFPIGLSR